MRWFVSSGVFTGGSFLFMFVALSMEQVSIIAPLVNSYAVFVLVLAPLVARPSVEAYSRDHAVDWAAVMETTRQRALAIDQLTAQLAKLAEDHRTLTGDYERLIEQSQAKNEVIAELHARCLEMRAIAAGVRGANDHAGPAEEVRTPGLDRLLWLFLRLLLSKAALDRFLMTMNEKEIAASLEQLRTNLQRAQGEGDDRIVRSLQDSVAMAELRLDNHARARRNAQFVSIELDRIENKIQALAEMAVNRQDPDFLSSQVDSAAESMRQTEKAVSELQHLTGLADQLEEPPAILESDLREVLPHDA